MTDGFPTGSPGRFSGAAAPEGWFSDPWQIDSLRWWDGKHWTGYTSGHPGGTDASPVAWGNEAVNDRLVAQDDQRFSIWIVVLGGALVLVIGLALGIGNATSAHGTAVVFKQGPCVTTNDAGLVCDEYVEYHDGRHVVRALMHGVHPDEVHGPPTHRTLAITYSPGDTGPPSTDDMPLWVPLGLGISGALLLLWGLFLRSRKVQAPGAHLNG